MANWSDTKVTLTGHPTSISAADKFIKKYIEDDWLDPSDLVDGDSIKDRSEFSGMDIHDYRKEDTSITIHGSGRWCSPSGFFILVARKFTLKLEHHDAEPGCNFYQWLTIDEDGLEENNEYDYNSVERINWQGSELFEDDLNCWYWADSGIVLDTNIENLIDHFGLERPNIDLYK
jgi:hypothetical protein